MESIGDARSFLSAAREVALTKPIIVIKPGRTEEASQAAAAHTGSMTGSDDVLDAAFRRCGVLRVDRISELFSMAEVLNTQPRLKGPRLTILTNAGGPGVLATDALIFGGGQLAPLASESIESLNRILPPPWSHGNPVDLLGDAEPRPLCPGRWISSPRTRTPTAVLVILTPQAFTRGRIHFLSPYGDATAPVHGSAFFYLGSNQAKCTRTHASVHRLRLTACAAAIDGSLARPLRPRSGSFGGLV